MPEIAPWEARQVRPFHEKVPVMGALSVLVASGAGAPWSALHAQAAEKARR
jgi:hypothetical protein